MHWKNDHETKNQSKKLDERSKTIYSSKQHKQKSTVPNQGQLANHLVILNELNSFTNFAKH